MAMLLGKCFWTRAELRPAKRTIHQKHFSSHYHLQYACYDNRTPPFAGTQGPNPNNLPADDRVHRKVSTDQTGRFRVTSSRGSKYLVVLYDHDSNAILSKPLASRNKRKLIQATRVLHAYLFGRGITPQCQILDNECPSDISTQGQCQVSTRAPIPSLHRRRRTSNPNLQ